MLFFKKKNKCFSSGKEKPFSLQNRQISFSDFGENDQFRGKFISWYAGKKIDVAFAKEKMPS